MAKVGTTAPSAEVELGECAGIAIVLDKDRESRKCLHQLIAQSQMVPTRQVRRIEEDSRLDPEWPPHRDADRDHSSTGILCGITKSTDRAVET
jgi:hypothetical protein